MPVGVVIVVWRHNLAVAHSCSLIVCVRNTLSCAPSSVWIVINELGVSGEAEGTGVERPPKAFKLFGGVEQSPGFNPQSPRQFKHWLRVIYSSSIWIKSILVKPRSHATWSDRFDLEKDTSKLLQALRQRL